MLTFTIFCLDCNFYFQGRCAFEVSDIVSEQNKNYMHLHSNLIVGTYFFFFIRNEENYIKRRKDTRERRDTREREENKRRMRGPSHKNKTKQKRKHPTLKN